MSETEAASAVVALSTAEISPSDKISLHFAKAIDASSISPDNITVLGPEGPVSANAALIDGGHTLEITPQKDLYPLTHYNLFISGLRDTTGAALPLASFGITTSRISAPTTSVSNRATTTPVSRSTRSSVQGDNERWRPTEANRQGRWRTARALPHDIQLRRNAALSNREHLLAEQADRAERSSEAPANPEPPLDANPDTSLTGIVLRQNDQPLAGVKVSLGTVYTQTDSQGEFTLSNIPAGQQELIVDGRDAGDGQTTQFGYFVIGTANLSSHQQSGCADLSAKNL